MSTFYHDVAPNAPGIYLITCTVNGKIYVGSAVNLRQRRKSHFGHLQREKHRNPKMQNAWLKHGEDAFTFEVIELVSCPELLIEREQHWMDKLNPFGDKGFNINPIAGSSLGRVMSQSSREKSRTTQLGRIYLDRRGVKRSPDAIERHRQSLTGYKHTEETKRNMGNSHRGSKRSLETREKIRIASLNHAPTNARTFIVTSPDGTEYVVTNGLPTLCRDHALNASTLVQVAKGKRKQHKGWSARYANTETG